MFQFTFTVRFAQFEKIKLILIFDGEFSLRVERLG